MTDEEIGLYSAEVLEDSIANGVRLTTVLATFPRFILAEVNTHRVFSRNSASSRAIPTKKLLDRMRAGENFTPATFNARVVGMGIGDELSAADSARARSEWQAAMEDAMRHASVLTDDDLNIDKSRANRLLEPFLWHTAIITSTEWSNFFALRCPDADTPQQDFPAQWEFQQTAILMRQAMGASDPVELGPDEWHRPMVDNNIDGDALYREDRYASDWEMTQRLNMVASRRLARVSFDKHTDTEPLGVSISKAGDLVGSAHFSPTEHVARGIKRDDLTMHGDLAPKLMISFDQLAQAMNAQGPEFIHAVDLGQVWCGNLRGYVQFRKTFAWEEDHGKAMQYR
nr:thymidylate synthase complementing protein [uncultured bacterium]